jgi:hypothetical protein
MAAINGANRGLGLVTLGLETDFPEDERNTDPGTAAVLYGTTYKIANVAKVGINMASALGGSGTVVINRTTPAASVVGASA